MVRILYVAAALVLAVFYYYFLGAGPGPSELPEDLEWWRPKGWLMRWDLMLGMAEMADGEGASSLAPVLLFCIPPLAMLVTGLYLFRAALARTIVVWLSVMLCVVTYYGVSAERVWRFFEWRFVAVAASFVAILASALFAPSLLRSLLRIPRTIAALLLLALFAGIFVLQTEITGTNPDMRFNISPWPVITVFGMLFTGYMLAAFHLSAGAGLWLSSKLPGAGGVAAGAVVAAGLAALGAGLIFTEPPVSRLVTFGIIAAVYMVLARRLASEETPVPASALSRIAAGLMIVAMIGASDRVAISNQVTARDSTARTVLLALEEYKKSKAEYPDRLAELVPDFLNAIPKPQIGLIRQDSDEFDYSSFGDSYALEFASVYWVQCAYSPPYEFATYDEDEEEEAEEEDRREMDFDEDVDVAARVESDDEKTANESLRNAGLAGSWNCPREPPKIW